MYLQAMMNLKISLFINRHLISQNMFVYRVSGNVDWMKMYVIQSKNGIIMSVDVRRKQLDEWGLVKRVICGIPICVIACVINHVKLMNVWILKIVFA